MKIPRNLYSRLSLVACLMLVTWYALVYAWTTLDPNDAGSGKLLTSTLMQGVINNINDLNTRVSNFSFSGGNVGVGVSPNAAYKLDVNGKIKGAGTAEAWSVKNTAGVGQTDVWTAVPGLSSTITLSRPALLHLASGGVQRWKIGTCHVGYRYVVDGVPRGHPTWGQHIQTSISTTPHMGWSLIEGESLAAGVHTIVLEARNQDATANWCQICTEEDGSMQPYESCTMNISTFYQ